MTKAPPRQPQILPHSHLRLSNKKSIENLLLFTANRSSYDWFLGEGGVGSSAVSSPWLSQPSDNDAVPCLPLVGLPTCDSLLASPLGSCLNTIGVSVETMNCSIASPTVNQVSYFSITANVKINGRIGLKWTALSVLCTGVLFCPVLN